MLQQLIIIFHILTAVALVGLILLQRGKGASMGAAFGSGASQTVFGSKGSLGFLTKLTIFLAAAFFATSLGLTYFAAHQVQHKDKNGTLLTNVEHISKMVKQGPPSAKKIQKKTNHK